MEAQSIDFFADEAGIGDKNTVSNGPDDGANNSMAACFWRVKRHGTTAQAVDNGLTALASSEIANLPEGYGSTGALNIGGHGNSGVLETGMGQTGSYDDKKWLSTWNEYSWGPEVDKIKPSSITLVSIWSCHTGADSDGAELLYAMAKRCGRAVRGRTGFTYTNGKKIWFEKGSVWQVATPANKPDPIPAPSPHFTGIEPMKIGKAELAKSDIKQVKITMVNTAGKALQPLVLRGADASEILTSLINSVPLAMDGVHISGFITAQIEVSLKGKGASTWKFSIYNDRLAVEDSERVGFYLTSSVAQLFSALSR